MPTHANSCMCGVWCAGGVLVGGRVCLAVGVERDACATAAQVAAGAVQLRLRRWQVDLCLCHAHVHSFDTRHQAREALPPRGCSVSQGLLCAWRCPLAPHHPATAPPARLPLCSAGQRELALRGVRAQQQEPPMRFKPHVHRLWQFPVRGPGVRLWGLGLAELLALACQLPSKWLAARSVSEGGQGMRD